MGGGLICRQCTSSVGGRLMFMGSDHLMGSGCRSGMGGHCFVMLSLCFIVCMVAMSPCW